MMSCPGGLKKTVFYEMLNAVGRVFIVARHSDGVMIGTRGFTEEEIKNGIVLVFNTSMSFSWDDSGISSTLVFGTTPHKCFIPAEDIVVIYSPELNAQFVAAPLPGQESSDAKTPGEEQAGEGKKRPADSKVVKVDFQKKKR
jgi:hypothetical protein